MFGLRVMSESPGRRGFMRGMTLGLLALGFTLAAGPLAANGVLDSARAAGIVGERFDGYAVVRDANASGDIRQLVADVNAKRKQVYEARAASEGVPVAQVGRVYAVEISKSAPRGTWFQLESGSWVQN